MTTQSIADDDLPLTLARHFLAIQYTRGDEPTLWAFRGEFFGWDGTAYRVVEPERFRAQVWGHLDGLRVNARSRGGKPGLLGPQPRDVAATIDALAAVCHAPVTEMPAWIGPGHRDPYLPRPADVIAFQNGLLDLADFDPKSPQLRPPTPRWFSRQALPYDFYVSALCPRWLTFLEQIFEGDSQRVALLQEWFGYLLTSDTSKQKMLMMVGPRRSGKGTIIRALQQVVGLDNCASPSLSSLAEPFGLEPLVGRTAAIVPDAHLGRNADTARILDRLLSISGEDAVNIERKHKTALPAMRLPIRFTLAVNQIPNLPDASNAIIPRLLILPFRLSFVGREDYALEGKLRRETPGVMCWALAGLLRLREQGRFTEVDAARRHVELFEESNSPVQAFVRQRCVLGDEMETPKRDLFEAWRRWAADKGHRAGAESGFGRQMLAAYPEIETRRPRGGGDYRPRVYAGIGLLAESWLDGDDHDVATTLRFSRGRPGGT